MTLRAEALSRTAWIHSKPARLPHLELNAGHVKLGKVLLLNPGDLTPKDSSRSIAPWWLHSTVKDMSHVGTRDGTVLNRFKQQGYDKGHKGSCQEWMPKQEPKLPSDAFSTF